MDDDWFLYTSLRSHSRAGGYKSLGSRIAAAGSRIPLLAGADSRRKKTVAAGNKIHRKQFVLGSKGRKNL